MHSAMTGEEGAPAVAARTSPCVGCRPCDCARALWEAGDATHSGDLDKGASIPRMTKYLRSCTASCLTDDSAGGTAPTSTDNWADGVVSRHAEVNGPDSVARDGVDCGDCAAVAARVEELQSANIHSVVESESDELVAAHCAASGDNVQSLVASGRLADKFAASLERMSRPARPAQHLEHPASKGDAAVQRHSNFCKSKYKCKAVHTYCAFMCITCIWAMLPVGRQRLY